MAEIIIKGELFLIVIKKKYKIILVLAYLMSRVLETNRKIFKKK